MRKSPPQLKKQERFFKEKSGPVPFVPRKYQEKGILQILKYPAKGLIWDPGLGKTSTILAASKILLKKRIIDFVLVVAPLNPCYMVWPQEIKKWKDFAGMTGSTVHGYNIKSKLDKPANFYFINGEGLVWLQKNWPKAWNRKKIMLVVDESTKFKSHAASKFKVLKNMLNKFKRRYILTGTPIPRSYHDLWSQVYILDQGKALGPNITTYRSMYFYCSSRKYNEYTLYPDADKDINKLTKSLLHRLEADDWLELPKELINKVYIELPPKVRKLYDEMEEEFIIELRDGEIIAVNAGVKSSKLRQIANGGIYHHNKKVNHLHYEKANVVKDILDELNGKPALVAYDTHHDLERLIKVLGKKSPVLNADVKGKAAVKVQDAWNAGELPYLLTQPIVAALGLNLQGVKGDIIWHSLTHNYEVYDQLNKRLRRQGYKGKTITYHFVLAEKTVDDYIIMSNLLKFTTQKKFLDGLKQFYNVGGKKQ